MLHRHNIRFCSAADGTRIAVDSIGRGPPLLRAGHWLSHVEYDFKSPIWRPWLFELSQHNTYIRYDQRGCGLSDRDVPELSVECWVNDLEAVVDGLGLRRFPLMGMSQGGAIALTYAVRHPEKVSHLILVGAYARGLLRRTTTERARLEAETLVNLIRLGWGSDNPAFRQVFTNLYIPGGKAEQQQWWTDLQRISASPENAAKTLEALHQIDVTEQAERLRVPTIVMHARGDARVPFDEGRRLAALIPDAKFMPLESDNHVLLDTEPAWPFFLEELRGFLGPPRDPDGQPARSLAELTPSETEVLRQVSLGLDNQTIATRLHKHEKTVRNQLSSILSKLGLKTRAEVIVFARDNGVDD